MLIFPTPGLGIRACNEFKPRRIASTLSYEEFIEAYALRGRPVVLKGGVSLCFRDGRGWDREALRKEAGDKVRPSVPVP